MTVRRSDEITGLREAGRVVWRCLVETSARVFGAVAAHGGRTIIITAADPILVTEAA